MTEWVVLFHFIHAPGRANEVWMTPQYHDGTCDAAVGRADRLNESAFNQGLTQRYFVVHRDDLKFFKLGGDAR